ncbi:MAG: hypothetical protein ACLFSQ_01300 [Candidatus Zixiibacteriota bacterium]
MEFYINFAKNYPILSGMLQFAILGPIGEFIAAKIRGKKWQYTAIQTILKGVGWAILAIFIKYVFVGFGGFVKELVGHNMLPQAFEPNAGAKAQPFLFAFSKSFFTNVMFGPVLFFVHRFFDNVIESKKDYSGLDKALLTLLWFWIPAHTITFVLPGHFQMGLAALWSIVLGIILGFFIVKN